MPAISSPLPAVTTTVSATTATTPHPANFVSPSSQPPTSIEAKLVILGSQGVGKTSLVNRLVKPLKPLPASSQATIGASFVTKKIHDPDTNTTVRLQLWDTAGQERFRSISRLYYRGANACLLCYDVTSARSFEEMKEWLQEMKENCDFGSSASGGSDMVIHIVGTKTDLVAADPDAREVPFEHTISYAAEQLTHHLLLPPSTSQSSTPPLSMRPGNSTYASIQSPDSKRSSGFWTSDLGWDSCHEVSAKDNDGIEEVFRVIARKLVEQRSRRDALELSQTPAWPPEHQTSGGDYFSSRRERLDGGSRGNNGSFRVGHGDRRKSWLGLTGIMGDDGADVNGGNSSALFGSQDVETLRKKGRCC